MAATLEREPVAATEDERSTLAEVERFLAQQPTRPARLVGPGGEQVELPESAFRLLKDIIHQLAQGHAVSVVPVQMELTTQEAADLLNVSRQYLVRLLEQGALPFHKTGTHRRICYGDLMDYRAQRDAKRRAGLRRLTRLSEDLGLYEE